MQEVRDFIKQEIKLSHYPFSHYLHSVKGADPGQSWSSSYWDLFSLNTSSLIDLLVLVLDYITLFANRKKVCCERCC